MPLGCGNCAPRANPCDQAPPAPVPSASGPGWFGVLVALGVGLLIGKGSK